MGVPAQSGSIQVVGSDSSSRFVQLGIGKSVVIDLPRDIKDVLVAEPKFANAVVRSTRRAYLIGVAVGQTNIYFFDAEGRQIAGRRAAVTAGDLDHAGPVRGPPNDRPAAVVRVDPVLDVGDEPLGELVRGRGQAPVRWTVEPLVVQPGRRDKVNAGPARQLRQLCRVPPALDRHHVDRGAQARRVGIGQLLHEPVDVGQQEVRRQLDRAPAVDDQVLVGIGHPHRRGFDVAEDGPDERHGRGSPDGSGETDAIDQPPSTFRSWPVTARDSSDRK